MGYPTMAIEIALGAEFRAAQLAEDGGSIGFDARRTRIPLRRASNDGFHSVAEIIGVHQMIVAVGCRGDVLGGELHRDKRVVRGAGHGHMIGGRKMRVVWVVAHCGEGTRQTLQSQQQQRLLQQRRHKWFIGGRDAAQAKEKGPYAHGTRTVVNVQTACTGTLVRLPLA
ncbi:hypothetical protein FGB62_242g016 [Gracilaria domingensis]|nr:hypothetical protein FGB62_242g016 [Gracilaria domingensis]